MALKSSKKLETDIKLSKQKEAIIYAENQRLREEIEGNFGNDDDTHKRQAEEYMLMNK